MKKSLRNELTSRFNFHIQALVIGPFIAVGRIAGASEGVISLSAILQNRFYSSVAKGLRVVTAIAAWWLEGSRP
jgi:hypothetical protein